MIIDIPLTALKGLADGLDARVRGLGNTRVLVAIEISLKCWFLVNSAQSLGRIAIHLAILVKVLALSTCH